MANNIEWAHTSAPTQTMTPLELYRADPDSPMLATEMGPWGAAILTGDASVAIYADNVIELLEWLEARAREVRSHLYRELSHKTVFTVEHTQIDDDGELGQTTELYTSTSRSAALWRYLEALEETPLDDHIALVEGAIADNDRPTLLYRDPRQD